MNTMILLHIVAVFIAFAFTTGVGIALTAIANTGDVRALRTAVRVMRPFNAAGGILLLVGVILGFGAAQMAGYTLGSTWLLVTFVAVALLFVFGFGVHMPWIARLRVAAAASPDDTPSADLQALIDNRFVRAAGPISGLLWIVILAMMVFRPA
jgi:uncharacterized membrane protein